MKPLILFNGNCFHVQTLHSISLVLTNGSLLDFLLFLSLLDSIYRIGGLDSGSGRKLQADWIQSMQPKSLNFSHTPTMDQVCFELMSGPGLCETK